MNFQSARCMQSNCYPASRGPSIFLDKSTYFSRKIEGPLLAGYKITRVTAKSETTTVNLEPVS